MKQIEKTTVVSIYKKRLAVFDGAEKPIEAN